MAKPKGEPTKDEWRECAEELIELISFENSGLIAHEAVVKYHDLQERED